MSTENITIHYYYKKGETTFKAITSAKRWATLDDVIKEIEAEVMVNGAYLPNQTIEVEF